MIDNTALATKSVRLSLFKTRVEEKIPKYISFTTSLNTFLMFVYVYILGKTRNELNGLFQLEYILLLMSIY